jgi:signal transduction histidine kinase/ActR/RegA family two-component response regulator
MVTAHEIRIPGIVILRELGRDAHGVDYRALQGERACLLRIALPCTGPERDQVFRTFRMDLVALARARHSTIPAVLEMGVVDERPYALTELPEGQTLDERLRWGPLREPSIVSLGVRILGGFCEVHRRGLVHGHLTPARIVFVDGDRDVRIVGFGSGPKTDAIQKESGPHDDFAALGRVLYESATGRVAFAGLTQGPDGDLTELPELSGGNEPLTSPELSALIARLLRCGSDRTPVDADSLLRDFERLQAGAPARTGVPLLSNGFAHGAPDEVPLIGRAHHLQTLRSAWSDARMGAGAIAHVRGPPGSGKTRLLRAFLQELSAEPRLLLRTHCLPGDTRPFATLAALLDEQARIAAGMHSSGGPRPESALRHAGQEMAPLLKRLSPELARLFADGVELGAPHEMRALFAEGAAEFLTRLLQSAREAILCVDDLQWMDAGSRAVLTRVADRARGSRTLFIVTSRTDEASSAEVDLFFRPIRALRRVDCTLGPLAEDECRQLVEAYLGTPGVPSEVVDPLVTLGDGTPMSLLEVLHAIAGEGLLVPHGGNWRLDRDGLERMRFPTHTRAILARRVAELSANTRRVMEAAAVLGLHFDERFLGKIVEGADCPPALQEARDARVLVRTGSGDSRFVHETVREALLAQMDVEGIRGVHQRIAERMDIDGGSDTDSVCRRAAAYGAGTWERAPARVFATNYEAGLRTFASYDNDAAHAFLTVAERAATEAGIEPDAEFYQTLGEVYLRRGALSKSREYFELALGRAREPLRTGILYSRVAWVDYTMGDTEGAWTALERAFAALSHKLPRGEPFPLAMAGVSWRTVRRELRVGQRASSWNQDERLQREALCTFHHQALRLALETDKSARFLAHVLQSMDQAEHMGPSRALVRSLLFYAFAQVALGFRSAGLARLKQADEMAEAIGDPLVSAYCLQIRSVIMGWAGDVDAALEAGDQLLLERGHWLELSEYCLLCWNQSLMLSARGQAEAAWQWIARGIDKIRHESHLVEISSFLEHAALATLSALGREAELSHHFEGIRRSPPQQLVAAGPHHRFSFGVRVRAFTERGDLGPAFEAFVSEVRSTIADPSRAHLALSEFYVHLAHARVQQCLHAKEGERRTLLSELSRSISDLRAVARVPVLRAHLWVLQGYQAQFEGAFLQASLSFSRADDLAQRENCPWVLYAVARGRAHLHKVQGRPEPAHTQATLAATIAETHGYAYRLRWIREEFPALAQSSAPDRVGNDGDSAALSQRLDALLQIGQTSPGDLNLAEQSKRIIDALLQCLRADRGIVFLAPEGGGIPTPIAGRDSDGCDIDQPSDYLDGLVRRAFEGGRTLVEHLAAGRSMRDRHIESAVASPLILRERIIGVVYLESSRHPFSDEDSRVLQILANQAAAMIELTRVLRSYAGERRERKLLEDGLRQAQKMEAIGRLAGTIAHDFNNLLAIISAALDSAEADRGALMSEELTDIRQACERGASLTSQLLTFSRRQVTAPKMVPLNSILSASLPLLRRLLPENIEIVTRLESEHDAILADPSRLEQVVLNLAANARDAMPGGGRLMITTRDEHTQASEGIDSRKAEDCVVLIVEDTGHGMAPEVLRQAFEPFFTTKPQGKGTGLGLSTAYGIVRQMRGRVTVDSSPGEGTVFRLYFPRAGSTLEDTDAAGNSDDAGRNEPGPLRSQVARRPETILLVDDERMILTALERGLIREGYRVIPALSGPEALDLVKKGGPHIDAVVSDVLMPGMTGPELVERLEGEGIRSPHLFISGYTDGALVPDRLREAEGLLVKPFTIRELVDRIRQMLDESQGAVERAGGS